MIDPVSTVTIAHVPLIDHDELTAALRRGAVTLVDVLSPESFASAHIAGAINIPVADLARVAPSALPNRDADIVVYCGGPT